MTFLGKITVELSGGCELLFGKQASLVLSGVVPTGTTVSGLVVLLRDKYLRERPEAFLDATGRKLRPGILCLVNDCDFEVVGGEDYALQEGDAIAFISTLHGG